jgi:hypothetical protein
VEETEESELMDVSIATKDGSEDDVYLREVDFLFGALSGWRRMREAVALAEGALALALVDAGFLVGAMMKDEHVNETPKEKSVKRRRTCQ